MDVPRHAFREYDVRGEAERDLTDALVTALGYHFAKLVAPDGGRIAVGRDGRRSSPRLFRSLVDGIRRAGVNVTSVGVGPTPMLYFAANHLAPDGAVMITGSHNPGPDNGFKMMRGKSSFFGGDIQKLRERIEADPDPQAGASEGTLDESDLTDAYIDSVRSSCRLPDAAKNAATKLVVDAGNGAAGPLGIATLKALGFEPDGLFCDIDGTFPNHHPDPTVPKNLEALIQRVKETKAKVGVAWDGDGDRIGAVDETGEIIWGDKLMILFSRALLKEHPGSAILGEVKCSQTMYDDIEKHGGRPIVFKTGHSLIKAKMKEEKAKLAGEMSGHIFFADRYLGFDDAIYATARLLEIVGATDEPLSALLKDVPTTYATPEIRVDCPDELKFDVVSAVRDLYSKTHDVNPIDGARIDFGDGAWGLCRASNTQPVLVLRFEAKSEKRRDEIRAEVEKAVEQARDKASA